MNFETLKKSHLKRNIIIGVVVVLVVSAVILNFTRAKYRVTQSIPLVNGTINYSLADLNVVALYIDGTEADELDSTKQYTLDTTNSTCTYKDGSTISNLSLSYDSETGQLNISPFTTKGTKCYLYFDEKVSAGESIIANKNISDERSGAITSTLTTNTTGKVYSVADDWGTSYAYAGAPTDNYVKFAGFWWRIIRINGDGSIRIIYDGTTSHENGESSSDRQITTSAYNYTYGDNAYVGYMMGLNNQCTSGSCSGSTKSSSYNQAHSNTYDSTIKDVLDNWYKTNILDKNYDKYVSKEAGFCNDRKVVSGYSGYGTLGYGTNATVYAPTSRFLNTSWSSWLSSQTPTLKCSQSNDLFTISGSSKGNHALEYPIGLITIDEVVVAGGFGGSTNQSYYLYTGQYYWTMSPSYADSYGNAYVFFVWSNGTINYYGVANTRGVRPVINLDPSVTLTGSGTVGDPFEIMA